MEKSVETIFSHAKQVVVRAAASSHLVTQYVFKKNGGGYGKLSSIALPEIRELVAREQPNYDQVRVFFKREKKEDPVKYYVVGVIQGQYFALTENMVGKLDERVFDLARQEATCSVWTTNEWQAGTTMFIIAVALFLVGITGLFTLTVYDEAAKQIVIGLFVASMGLVLFRSTTIQLLRKRREKVLNALLQHERGEDRPAPKALASLVPHPGSAEGDAEIPAAAAAASA